MNKVPQKPVYQNTAASVRSEWDKSRDTKGNFDPSKFKSLVDSICKNGVSHDELIEASKIREEFLDLASKAQLVAGAMQDKPGAAKYAQTAQDTRDTATIADALYWAVASSRFNSPLSSPIADLLLSLGVKVPVEE